MLELFMDPLGALVVTFFVMSIISVAALVLVYFLKNEKAKKGLLYLLSVWAVIIAYCGVLSTPPYMIGEILITLAIGGTAIAAVVFQFFSKRENKFQIARVLVTFSVIAGMIDCFMI
ncbi:MAG: hypothetical protein IKJ16_07850 [Agathobacter sp.]|nr:hypothetical protein [Agathobacter sp.]